MANLEVPSLTDEDSSRSELAKKIIKLAKTQLLKNNLRFEKTTKNSCMVESISKGHLFRVYPLNEKSINELYLEKGYAIYSPCDTLYMDEYREANSFSMNKRVGIWKPVSKNYKPDMFNRFRFSLLIVEQYFEEESFVPPLFGLNYRWSDLITIVKQNSFSLNASIETGTFVYFALPYANFGAEARYKNFYVRTHYDVLLPFFLFYDPDDLDTFRFWGFDMGFIIPVGSRQGIEIEYNIKSKDGFEFFYISVSFAAY